MDLGLADRVYLVTGGSQGLGLAVAGALVRDGAKVVLSSREQANIDAARAHLGPNAVGIVGDNADPDLPGRLLALARSEFGRVDGLLVSVGGPPPGAAMDITDEQWERAFSSVFLGAVRLVREVAAELTSGAAIGLVLSTSARQAMPNLSVSNGLRPGLAMLATTFAAELGPRGVRVFGLLPGSFTTGRNQRMFADPEVARKRVAEIPLGRFGDPDEFGAVAAFALSPVASYLTGGVITVDGGVVRGF